MNDATPKFRTLLKRPVNCTENDIKLFKDLVLSGGEAPIANLNRGLQRAEMLFFTITENNNLAGVSAIRFQNDVYHKHLFEQAGVPEMYNPYSVESCWLAVAKTFRGQGVWKINSEARLAYIGNRPCHATKRMENKDLTTRLGVYTPVGEIFQTKLSDDLLMLGVYNHDLVFDENKRLQYV